LMITFHISCVCCALKENFCDIFVIHCTNQKKTAFSALMLLVGRQDWIVGLVWLSVWNDVQTCMWPSWCHCHSLSLASVKSRLVLPLWYRLTWVVPDKGPLNGCVCVCVCARADQKKRFRAHNLAAVWGDCKFFLCGGIPPPQKKDGWNERCVLYMLMRSESWLVADMWMNCV